MTLPAPAPAPPPGYLDAVGGQPLLPVARDAWLAAVDAGWSDPARLHHEGRRAGALLDAARASIAASLGVLPAEVYLTTSGPTAIGVAVGGLLHGRPAGGRRVVASAVESMAVLSPARGAAEELELVPVDHTGRVVVAEFERALARPAALACLQVANPEVGTVQPVAEVAELTRAGVDCAHVVCSPALPTSKTVILLVDGADRRYFSERSMTLVTATSDTNEGPVTTPELMSA